jgi:branched-chain amino acid transport system ATP-binding protein
MLKIRDLKAGYNGNEVLHGINLDVKAGEIVAIIGPNGSGKSTIINSIFKLASVYEGKIVFMNKDITKLTTHEIIYEGISCILQGRRVFGEMTVHENLEMGAFSMNNPNLLKANIKEVYDTFPILKEKQNDSAFTLSGGQQQILSIARALMQNPKLILLDEPSLGLSPKATSEVFDIIKELNRRRVSIIIVEQNAKKAVEIADKTYVLENGKIALSGGKEILKNKRIRHIYFGGR